jgi:hypothetical protein
MVTVQKPRERTGLPVIVGGGLGCGVSHGEDYGGDTTEEIWTTYIWSLLLSHTPKRTLGIRTTRIGTRAGSKRQVWRDHPLSATSR